MQQITLDPRHDHLWIASGYLHESYRTIRGLRYRTIAELTGVEDSDSVSTDRLKELGFSISLS